MSESIEDLVQAALNQDYTTAEEIFGSVMSDKMTDALEQEKISVANQIYNGGTIEADDDIDLTDEELDDIEYEEDDADEEDQVED